MYVRDLKGDEFPLQATLNHEMELNGNQSVSATIYSTKVNSAYIDDITEMWELVDFDDVSHKIIYCKKKGEGNHLTVEVKAIPLFFDTFDTLRIYEEYNEHMTAQLAFTRVFADTGFSFVLVDAFDAVQWEGFGGGESRLETFKRALERYQAEFRISGNTVYLHKQIGRDTQFQYRHRLNASNITQENDASAMWTYAKGYGDYGDGDGGEDWKDAKLIRKYTSPLSKVPGIGVRHAPPIQNGNIKVASFMDEQLKNLVDNSLKISVSADIHDLRKQGYSLAQPELGDRVFLIDERIGLDEEVRVVNISITRNWKGEVSDISLRFGTEGLTKRHQSNIQAAVKAITELIEGRRKLPSSVLENAILEATKALKNAQTELKFTENGILAIEKGNPNYVVLFNSAGVGVSEDGGATFRTAMTGRGFVADLITSGHLMTELVTIIGDKNHFFWDDTALQAYHPNDSSKFAKLSSRGLDIQNGMIQVKGQAGTVIIDGTSNMHKILATGLVTMSLPAGTIKRSVSFSHNLGYKPAYSAYMQGDDYNEEDDLLSHQLPYLVTDHSSGGVDIKSVVRAECTTKKITFTVHRATDYGNAMPAKTLTFRYFVYKEVAF